jgi:cytochrome c553
MKLFITIATFACYLCIAFGCNSASFRSGTASLTAQGSKTMKDEYKLSTDSKDPKGAAVTFSHVNHSTKNYSIDGTKTIGCTECHHTDQPASEAAKRPPLKTAHPADRTVILTAESVKDAKTPDVVACRSCHAKDGETPKLMAEMPQVTPEGETDPIMLNNQEAFHRNCNGCHDQAAEARKTLKIPTTNDCKACHTGK